jgi:hypothetical protein
MREALVGSRTKLVNTVRGRLRGEGRRPRNGELTTLAARVRGLDAETRLPTYVERQLRALECAVAAAELGAGSRALFGRAQRQQIAFEDPVCEPRSLPIAGLD